MDETVGETARDAARARMCPVVAVGASAGGIGALMRFLPAIEAESGLAYIIVLHLDPEHESNLPEILGRASAMPVTQALDGQRIEANHVYVIPPNATLTVVDGCLGLVQPRENRGHRTPIDHLFASLAEDQEENAACVVLSGTGSDGTFGLRAIKEHGGLTLAQTDAEYDGMVRSARATGLVDIALPAADLPARIAAHFQHLDSVMEEKGLDKIRDEVAAHLGKICDILRNRTGHDFSGYKQSTIIRRIQRRMHVLQVSDGESFLTRLEAEPREIDLLFQDLLIGVTEFFRDREAFEALERDIIPKLFKGKGAGEDVRAWVPGCASGEEAYSIAMLLCEQAPEGQRLQIQIFASDIDERSLDVARTGRYPASIEKQISPERLKRFFVREDGSFRVIGELREMCLFSKHDLLRDPPFSRIDLISCRNLLIYIDADLQKRIIPLFHYALRDEGYLFLGASENVTRHAALFEDIDRKHRIFRKRSHRPVKLPEFPLSGRSLVHRPFDARRAPAEQASLQERAERRLLDHHAPAHVIINGSGDILYTSARTGKYFEMAAGAPDNNVFSLARPGLRQEIRAVFHSVTASGQPAISRNITIGTNGGRQTIDLVMEPIDHTGTPDATYMLIFRDVGNVVADDGIGIDIDIDAVEDSDNAVVKQLEIELRATRERLQTTTEELESSNEELRSANEELSSMNEELQSANEELETSKEELQSINEELQTVNAELSLRVDELSAANADIANLLQSTQIATIFLDREYNVRSFTPAAKGLYNLVEGDLGRPISHMRPRFREDSLQKDAQEVLRKLVPIERRVESIEGDERYSMRVLPYRTPDNVIGGVVITFVDITQILKAEERIVQLSRDLRDRVESLEALLDLVPVGILIAEDPEGRSVRLNRCAANLIEGGSIAGTERPLEALEALSRPLRLLRDGSEIPPEEQPLALAGRTGQPISGLEASIPQADGSKIEVLVSASPLFDEAGKTRGAIAGVIDITRRKQDEAHQVMLLHELQHRVKNILATVTALASRLLRTNTNFDAFRDAFLSRLQAMSRTHELLASQRWDGAEMRDLGASALGPYTAGDNICLSGPSLFLKPNEAATLGMVLHELASNAAKYGAFAHEGGCVDLSWEVKPDGERAQVEVVWREHGGKAVESDIEPGFGTTFITRSLRYELGGSAVLDFAPDGLTCRLSFPVRKLDAVN
jgi:two-component system, chemotaxis family, CheB/CheR fusion protein